MKFGIEYELKNKTLSIPTVLIGRWSVGVDVYEIKSDNRYYVLSGDIPIELTDGGATLLHGGTRYNRVSGNASEFYGVWSLESDPTEEWTLRADNSYTYHFSNFVYVGFFDISGAIMNSGEMRAVLSEDNGTLTFSPPYSPPLSGAWSVAGSTLTVSFPTGDVVYTKI